MHLSASIGRADEMRCPRPDREPVAVAARLLSPLLRWPRPAVLSLLATHPLPLLSGVSGGVAALFLVADNVAAGVVIRGGR
jgi:hypothetical protein